MTVRSLLAAWFTAVVLLLSGCGGSGNTVTSDETMDPLYQQAQDLKRQGRNGEALSAFLKEIDRRGENGAPESHLAAGTLYLNWLHDPFEAYHHFGKFLELRPNDRRADNARGQRLAAQRDASHILLAPQDQSMSADQNQEVEQLRRRVQELQAEVDTLHGAGAVAVTRAAPTISLGDDSAAPAASAVPPPNQPAPDAAEPSPLTPAPNALREPSDESPFTRSLRPAPAAAPRPVASAPVRTPVANAPAASPRPTPNAIVAGGERGAVAPTRPGAVRPAAPATAGRRSHTVVSGEKSLWGIARRYYGPQAGSAQVQAIYNANRDVMKSPGDLRVGMVLRIP